VLFGGLLDILSDYLRSGSDSIVVVVSFLVDVGCVLVFWLGSSCLVSSVSAVVFLLLISWVYVLSIIALW